MCPRIGMSFYPLPVTSRAVFLRRKHSYPLWSGSRSLGHTCPMRALSAGADARCRVQRGSRRWILGRDASTARTDPLVRSRDSKPAVTTEIVETNLEKDARVAHMITRLTRN